MAKQAVKRASLPGPIGRVQAFYESVREEMKKVAWPSRDEIKQSTSIVLLMLGIMALIVAVYDIVFTYAVRLILMLG